MGSTNPFYLAAKSIDDQTIVPTGIVAIATCVGYDGNQVSVAGGDVRGIAKSDGVVGNALNIAVMGTVAARVGAAITGAGIQLTPDASGRLVPALPGQSVFARSLYSATAADQYIEVFITREGEALNDSELVTPTAAVAIGCAVDYNGNQIATAGVDALGIATTPGITGIPYRVATSGKTSARTGAAVALGAQLTPDSQGRLVTATTGQIVLARARAVATAADQYIQISISREGKA